MLDYFQNTGTPEYSHFIATSRYSRWLPEQKRRETWEETVNRMINFFQYESKSLNLDGKVLPFHWDELREATLNLEVMPSMRILMSAGEALNRENLAAYNCSYSLINDHRAFAEELYILMNGTGFGFGVPSFAVNNLHYIDNRFIKRNTWHVIRDSKRGWAEALLKLIEHLYVGQIPRFDFSEIRPAGARLKTFGGRASGPEPLMELFEHITKTFVDAKGRKLRPIEAHDMCCNVADAVVVGGVRRSSLISLSDLHDEDMRYAKSGNWFEENPVRQNANNSVIYNEKPSRQTFDKEWKSIEESKAGERGIFNAEAVRRHLYTHTTRNFSRHYGVNPCGEIILPNMGLCNLSEVVVRENDTYKSILEKLRIATIYGTLQSALTDFKFVRKEWSENAKDERLLGVSMTGVMDSMLLNEVFDGMPKILSEFKSEVRFVNAQVSKAIGINKSKSYTCMKPSGTVSQLVDCSSGIHTRYAPYYIRRVRADVKDPLAQFMKENNFPCEPAVGKEDAQLVFSFPIKSPKFAKTKDQMNAIAQLEYWKVFRNNWTTHNPSATIYIKNDEWNKVGNWVYENFDEISGLSFLPAEEGEIVYPQLPYEAIDEETYNRLLSEMPKNVDWSKLAEYESEDDTKGAQTFSCTAGVCEIVDLI